MSHESQRIAEIAEINHQSSSRGGLTMVTTSKSDEAEGEHPSNAADQRPADPAERIPSLRVFYSGWRPTRLGKLVNDFQAWVSGLGLTPELLVTLQVRGRTSGKLHSNVLVSVNYNGQRYLVSMLGEGSEWVRNVRAAGGEAFIKRGRRRPIMLSEVPSEERAPILQAYCQVATSGRHHFPVAPSASLADFASIASYYPVFRINARDRP